MSYIPERDGDRERYEAPRVDPWTRAHLDAAQRQHEALMRRDGTASARPGGWLDQTEEQLDGSWSPRPRRDAEGVDSVSGQRTGRWLQAMADRMQVTEHPAPQGPPQRNAILEAFRAQHLAEQAERQAADERSRTDGWLGRVERQIVAGAEQAAAEMAELEQRAADRAEERQREAWFAAREERRAAAEQQRQQLVAEIAEELEQEAATRAWEERKLDRARWAARARRAEAAELEEAEFGDWWGGDDAA